MRVTLIDRELENDDYLPLKYGKEYIVACISADLEGASKCFIYLYEPDNTFANPFAYDITQFAITDPTIPTDWITHMFTADVVTIPTLVCAPPFIAEDVRFFINLHDICLTENQRKEVLNYINSLEKSTQT